MSPAELTERGVPVAREILAALAKGGARTVFGLPGTHNLAFWDGHSGPPRLVNVRHEQAAVYAADGWARASGLLGAAVVTTGPGAANTLAAFGEAAMSGSPVVLVASEVPRELARAHSERTLHESKDQAAMFRPLAKATFSPRSPGEVADDITKAITTAMAAPRGPVYVDIPADVLLAPGVEVASLRPPAPVPLDEKALEAAARLIGPARTVAIWAGGGVVAADAAPELAALAAHLQAPVITTFSARGALGAGHPCDVVLPPHEPEVEQLLASADVLLALGTDFDGMMTKNATLRLPRTIIDVNVDLEKARFGYEGVFPVQGDAGAAIRELLGLTNRRTTGLAQALVALKQRVWARLRADPSTREAAKFVATVERAAPAGTVLVNDMAIPGYWVGNYCQASGSRTVQYPVGWGTLGYALPASIGAAFASGRPVLAVCGDGGFMFGLGELATIAQEQLPVTVLLFNDNGYGMLRYGHGGPGRPAPGSDLKTPDFVALARAFGIGATLVSDVGAPLEESLVMSLASKEPRMVVCEVSLIPPRTTSARWDDPS